MRCLHLLVRGVRGQLVVDAEAQLLLRRLLGQRLHGEDGRHVHGKRLGHVHVAAGVDRRGGLLGIEVGDVFENQRLDTAVERPLVARETAESFSRRDTQLVAHRLDGLLEVVDRGHDLVSRVLFEQTGDPASPAAQPHDPDAKLACDGACRKRAWSRLLGPVRWTRRPATERRPPPQSAQQISGESGIDLSSWRGLLRVR